MIRFIIIGIIQGAVIGLLALGIVLVYKGTRVFNFAQAEFGTLAVFFTYMALEGFGLPYPVAVVFGLVAVGLVGFLMERLVVRPLFDAPRVTLLVASAGVALLAISLELNFGGAQIRRLAPAIQGAGITVFGQQIKPQELLLLAVLVGLGVALAYFFNRTDLGLAVLATSQEPVATELVGIGTRRMSTFIWVFAAVLGGIAGVMQGPVGQFTPGFMTVNFLLYGFTAAVLGGVTSLAGAFVGGQMIGITRSLASYFDSTYIPESVDIPGFPELIVFTLLLTVLIVRPKGLLGAEA